MKTKSTVPFGKCLAVASLLFLVQTSQRVYGQGVSLGNGATMEVLGTGTAALLGVTGGAGKGPLTDPDMNGSETAGPTDPSWDWNFIESNAERGFNSTPVDGFPAGTERSYNVFDHNATGGGDAKWCCGEPIGSGAALATTPLYITVGFPNVYRLTHFTLTSGNDTPTRDPRDWRILGSQDNITFEPIFTQQSQAADTVSLWGTTRDQVIKFTFDRPSKAYKYFKFECTATFITGTGAFFQIDEIEYFGLPGPGDLEEITIGTGTTALIKGDVTDPENDGNKAAGATDASWNWKSITANDKAAFGTDGAFNVFDNSIGSGTDRWSTTAPSAGSPKNITVEFKNPLVVTMFTVSSAENNAAQPLQFTMQGSTDGVTFTPFYTRNASTSLWTLPNQVARITLKDPTPPYKFVRFEVTQTVGGTDLQVGEIEIFGKYGGLSNPGVSGVVSGADFLALKISDGLDTTFDPATGNAKLTVDGTAVTISSNKNNTVSILRYNRSPVFASASAHTYTITGLDSLGNTISRSGSFTVPTYTTVATNWMVASVDTTKPGFRVKTHQMSYNRNPGTGVVPNAERQIANGYTEPGLPDVVANTADLSLFGADGYFIETDTINYDQTQAATGQFTPLATPPQDRAERLVPGITTAATDRFVQSIETFLQLKAGYYRLGIVTDDGVRMSFGRGPGDVVGAQIIANGGVNNPATVDILIQQDGFYPARFMWFEIGGGAYAEWYTIDPVTGVGTLINDATVATSVKAFRESTNSRPYISRSLPSVNYSYALADQPLIVDITDGAIPVNSGTIRVQINNTDQTVTTGKTGAVTTVTRASSLTNLLPSGVNNVNVIWAYTENGATVTVTNSYAFTVPSYTRPVPPGNKVLLTDVADPGFRIRANQIDRSKDGNQGNGNRHYGANMPGPEIQLAGGYIDPTTNLPYPNLANLTFFDGPGQTFYWPDVINFQAPSALDNTQVVGQTGDFQSGQNSADIPFPGIPGGGSSTIVTANPVVIGTQAQGEDNTVHEIVAYLDLKAGAYVFGVNADDGWAAWSSPNPHDTLGTLLGYRNGPGGNNGYPLNLGNAAFNVVILEDGVYPFRFLTWNNAGGVNIEIMTIDRGTGQHVLVNDAGGVYKPTTAGAAVGSPANAYATYNGTTRPWVKPSLYPAPYIGTATPLVTAGNAGPTLWQNRDQQGGPWYLTKKIGVVNGSWNSGEIQNSSTTTRPFGDAVGGIVADLAAGDTVGMILDGTVVTPSVTAIANSTDKLVVYTPPAPLSSTSNHIAGLIYAGTTNYWVFNVIVNTNIAATNALPSSAAVQSAKGFRVKVAQAAAARAGGQTVAAAELQLQGTPASITPAGSGPDGSYIIPGIINMNVNKVTGNTATNENGNFQTVLGGPTDDPVPGLPGPGLTGTARFENFTAEIFAYLDLPAGYQKFGINGDDGFRVQVGYPGQTNNTVLFSTDRSGGSTDFPFAFTTPQAGLYPVRIVWYQGGGGGNLEFFTYSATGDKIPVNSANGVKAYYNATGGLTDVPKITIGSVTAASFSIAWSNGGELQTATDIKGPWTGTGNTTGTATLTIGSATPAQVFYRIAK